jgi:hypothetical protein
MPQDINTSKGDPVAGVIRMEYSGPNVGSYTYNGRAGRTYRGGNNDQDRIAIVHPDDVILLERTSFWKRAPLPPAVKVEPKAEPAPPPLEPSPAIAPEPELQGIAVVEPEQMITAKAAIAAPKPRAKRGKGK